MYGNCEQCLLNVFLMLYYYVWQLTLFLYLILSNMSLLLKGWSTEKPACLRILSELNDIARFHTG